MIEKIRHLFQMGGATLGVLLAGGILALAVFLDRVWILRDFLSQSNRLYRSVRDLLRVRKFDEARSLCMYAPHPFARVFFTVLERQGQPNAVLVAASERARLRALARLRRPLWLLGTLGATMPFVGLLGTVLGIMDSFQALSSTTDPSIKVVGAGIAEALVSTAVGMGVAVVALVSYNYLQVRLNRIQLEWKWMAEEWMEEQGPLLQETQVHSVKTTETKSAVETKGQQKGDARGIGIDSSKQ